MMPRKLSEIVRIFSEIEYIKTRGLYFGQKESDQYFPSQCKVKRFDCVKILGKPQNSLKYVCNITQISLLAIS